MYSGIYRDNQVIDAADHCIINSFNQKIFHSEKLELLAYGESARTVLDKLSFYLDLPTGAQSLFKGQTTPPTPIPATLFHSQAVAAHSLRFIHFVAVDVIIMYLLKRVI